MAFDPSIQRKDATNKNIEERIGSFCEVKNKLNKEDILEQTKRCLSCPKPRCVEACPIHLPIPGFIKALNEGDNDLAYHLIYEVSSYNGICAIVCDQAKQCEGACIRGIKDKPVNIGAIHRYIAFLNKEYKVIPTTTKDKKVAIIGAGPSGLACLERLVRLGYKVDVYDANDKIGGIPNYGIPNFRLDNADLNFVLNKFNYENANFYLNKKIYVNDILDQYDAIYLSIGTQNSKKMRIPGEELRGIFTGEELLKDIKINNNAKKYQDYQNVIVVGAGNVAMDVSRTLIRLGKNVTIIYRRSIEEAPCRKEELIEAKEEGINLSFLTNPVAYIGNDKVKKVKLIKMELGESDASGRRSPKEIPNSEYELDIDAAFLAIGSGLEKQYVNDIELNWNLIKVNDKYQTNKEKVFAGGDAVTGPKTVVHAVKAGIDAAIEIDKYLNK